MGKARVDQQSNEDYARKATEFEAGMAGLIVRNGAVNGVVDLLLARVRNIVDAWANHTGANTQAAQDAVYEREFAWSGGDKYFGAFDMTAANILGVFNNAGASPLRSKLKIVYNAVRNNNLAKWLRVAALEIDRANRGRPAQTLLTRTRKTTVTYGPAPAVNQDSYTDNVAPGFAAASGLTGDIGNLSAAEQTALINTARAERQREAGLTNTGFLGIRRPVKRDTFGDDRAGRSAAMDWDAATTAAAADRRGKRSAGIPLADQRTLTVGDLVPPGGGAAPLPDMTDAEIDLILKRQGNAAPDPAARATYRAQPAATRVPWEQGSEYYDVKPASTTARAARQIRAHLEAGISGSTDLMLHASKYLGFNTLAQKQGLRLALAGWMMANRDHSFYEVFQAATAYGVPFNTNPAAPGSEYEDAANLAPMNRANFAGVLPADGPLAAPVFPANYLSMAWKDHLEQGLVNPADTQAVTKEALRTQHGITSVHQSIMSEAETAALASLAQQVQGLALPGGATTRRMQVQAHRSLQNSDAYAELVGSLHESVAIELLGTLIAHHHPAEGGADMRDRARLLRLGLPRVLLDHLTAPQMGRLIAADAIVAGTPPPIGAAYPAAPVMAALAPTGLPAISQWQITGTLIRHHYPNAVMPAIADPTAGGADYGATADMMNTMAEFEQLARTKRTTGVWYSWNPGARSQRYANAASVMDATADVSSTQGRGIYLGDSMTASEGYGQAPGNRLLIVSMTNVPTVDANDAGQMNRLARLRDWLPAAGDVLERKGLYSSAALTEFFLVYGANWGRLSATRGVRKTLDLTQAPIAEAQRAFADPAMSKATRDNFRAQARRYGLDIRGWPHPPGM